MRPLATIRVAVLLSAHIAIAACQTASPLMETAALPPTEGPAMSATSMEKAGEYLTIVGSCNDCHTQGWVESRGTIPAADRFAGLNLGFRGEWGTSYGKNLRTVVQRQSEDHWVEVLKTTDGGDGKLPMPWWNTRQMNERDLRAMYRYIKSLGPKPSGVPRSLPPGKEPSGPYIWVTPRPQ